MSSPSLPTSVTDYYLSIQALTPIDPAAPNSAAALPDRYLQEPAISVLIFLGVLLVGAFALLLTKTHQFNKMLVLLLIAFILSTVPLGLRALKQPVAFRSQADRSTIPTQLLISHPTTTGLTLTWQTDKPGLGAVRISTAPDQSTAWVVTETSTIPLTTHSTTISGLQPGMTYYLSLLSGSTWYGVDGRSIKVITAPP